MTDKKISEDLETKNKKTKKTKKELENELKGFDRIIGYTGIILALILPMIHNEMINRTEEIEVSKFVITLLTTATCILIIFAYYFLRSHEKTKLFARHLAEIISLYSIGVFLLDLTYIISYHGLNDDLLFLIGYVGVLSGCIAIGTLIYYKQSKNEYEI